MPFSSGGTYSRFKTFANAGRFLPSDLNAIQDDFGLAIQSGWRTGNIKMSALTGEPGWVPCDGTLLTIAMGSGVTNLRNALISQGSLYGSDGSGNPRVPNLSGRTPIGPGGAIAASQGGVGGETTHVLTIAEMPSHSHGLAGDPANANDSRGAAFSQPTVVNGSSTPNNSSSPIQGAGGGAGHNNVQPYQCVVFLIKL